MTDKQTSTTLEDECIDFVNSTKSLTFVSSQSTYKNCESYILVRCGAGHEFLTTKRRVKQGYRCQICAGLSPVTMDECINKLSAIQGMEFICFSGEYRNNKSIAVMRCDCGGEFASRVNNLLSGKGCPYCAQHGFSPGKPGFIYALVSKCGKYCKIGISNNHYRRIRELRNNTPFKFCVHSVYRRESGKEIAEIEKEFHRKYESAGFTGFNGATEWLKVTPELLEEFRSLSR